VEYSLIFIPQGQNMKKNCLLLICLGAAFTISAAESTTTELISLKEKVNLAIVKFENTERKLWSYKISRHEDEEGDITSSIEQYSPQESEPWLLKKINGQQPTKKQVKDFAKKKQEQNNKSKQGNNIQIKLRQLINQESLSLVSSDEETIVMAFNVYLKKLGKDSIGKLEGKLTYQKDEQFIESITVWNNETFSPMFTANITDLAITFTFAHINGSVFTKQNEMRMKGSFAYFTEINETSLDIYSDYHYHGE
jgi:hypothetical protein